MKVNTDVVAWVRLLAFAVGGAYLWRSATFPRTGEPKGKLDRALRLFGAILLSAAVLYFVGFALGLYG